MAADAWPDLRRLIDAGDVRRAAAAVVSLEEKERRGLAKRAREHAVDGSARYLAREVVEFGCATPSQAVAGTWHWGIKCVVECR